MAFQTNLASTSEPTISDIEQTVQNGLEALRDAPLNEQITAALKFLTPRGYRPIAQLEEDGRKKRSTASASNWSPETGEIVIYFERTEPELDPPAGRNETSFETFAKWNRRVKAGIRHDPLKSPSAERHAATRDAIAATLEERTVSDSEIEELCLALAEAEKAGKAFIALKWFRDNDLTTHGYAWTESLAHRQAVLSKAFDAGAVLTTQIPNPKAPLHPTTTIRLNRESKYAQAVAPRFQPIKLRGEGPTASEILLRDRERF
jgi:hypothetical protein